MFPYKLAYSIIRYEAEVLYPKTSATSEVTLTLRNAIEWIVRRRTVIHSMGIRKCCSFHDRGKMFYEFVLNGPGCFLWFKGLWPLLGSWRNW